VHRLPVETHAHATFVNWQRKDPRLAKQNRRQSTKQPAEIVRHRRPKDSYN
jgi:hypothetical protein